MPADRARDEIVDVVLPVPTHEQDKRSASDLAFHSLQLAADRPDSPLKDRKAQAVGGDLVVPSGSAEAPGERLRRLVNLHRPNLRRRIEAQARQVVQRDLLRREITRRRCGPAHFGLLGRLR
eukprot:15439046-Alexandrium_andersonii.AAC.1